MKSVLIILIGLILLTSCQVLRSGPSPYTTEVVNVTYWAAGNASSAEPLPVQKMVTRAVLNKSYVPQERLPNTCIDGTPEGNCSNLQPYWCDEGVLEKRPKKCGCPPGEQKYGDDCVVEAQCLDGTDNMRCAAGSPFRCINGVLVENSSYCCSDGITAEGKCYVPINCNDGTSDGQCSDTKPLQCRTGVLRSNISLCGCGRNQDAYQNQCMDADLADARRGFDVINEFLIKNDRPTISWNDDVRELAMLRSKDMEEKHYVATTSPQGTCANTYRSQFGLNRYGFIELGNAWVMGYGSFTYQEDGYENFWKYHNATSQMEMVIEDPDSREVLLMTDYAVGGIGCSVGICTFLAGSEEIATTCY